MTGLAVAEGCACRGVLEPGHYCVLVRGQEALERLLAADPFAEEPAKLEGWRDAQVIE